MEGLWIVGGRAAVSSVRLIGRPPARPFAGEREPMGGAEPLHKRRKEFSICCGEE